MTTEIDEKLLKNKTEAAQAVAPKIEAARPIEKIIKENLPEVRAGEQARPTEAGQKKPFAFPRLRKTPPPIPQVRNAITVKVEKIMEEGVGDAYARLSPIAREEFKLKGEETAQKISLLLRSAKVKVKKIFELILNWLRLLPGVNRFFLEQEAKIKTDRILELKNQQK